MLCMYICMWVTMTIHSHGGQRRTSGLLPHHLIPLETGPPTESGASLAANIPYQPSSLPPTIVPGFRPVQPCLAVYGCWRFELSSSCLHRNCSYPLRHFRGLFFLRDFSYRFKGRQAGVTHNLFGVLGTEGSSQLL